MLDKYQVMNVLTIFFAICSVITMFSNMYVSIIFCVFTLISYLVSRKLNETRDTLTEEERVVLESLKNKSEEK